MLSHDSAGNHDPMVDIANVTDLPDSHDARNTCGAFQGAGWQPKGV